MLPTFLQWQHPERQHPVKAKLQTFWMLPPTFDDETDKVSLFSMWLLVAKGGRERERLQMDVVIDAMVDFLLGKGKGQRREGEREAANCCCGPLPF